MTSNTCSCTALCLAVFKGAACDSQGDLSKLLSVQIKTDG